MAQYFQTPYDMPTSDLKKRFDDGKISSPVFQRRADIWSSQDKSRLIESMLWGLPIPTIYLFKSDDEKMEIIDGLQRISTVTSFLKNSFALKNLSPKFSILNGKSFNDLDESLKDKVLNYSFRVVAINYYPDKDNKPTALHSKIQLFSSLNSTGYQLTAQEIRASFLHSDFIEMIKSVSEDNNLWEEKFEISQDTYLRKRMELDELLIRFLLYSENGYALNGSLRETLNEYVERSKKLKSADVEKKRKSIVDAAQKTYEIFGSNAFTQWQKGKFHGAVKKWIFELQMLTACRLSTAQISSDKNTILSAFKKLCEKQEIIEAVRSNTSGEESIKQRKDIWLNLLASDGLSIDL